MEIFKLFGSVFVDTEKANESLSKTDDKAKSVGNTLMNGAKKAGKFALGLGAAATGVAAGLTKLASDSATTSDAIDKASQRMKIGAESYQELSHAASLSGVEMSTFEKAAKSLEGTDINLDDALAQIYALGTAEERSTKAAELFGDAVAYQMTPMLNASSEEMAAMKQEAHDLGLVLSEDAVKSGAELNDALSNVKDSIGGLVTNLGASLMPIILDVCNMILEFLPDISGMLSELAEPLGELLKMILPPLIELLKFVVTVLVEWVIPAVIKVVTTVKDIFTKAPETFKKFKDNIVNTFEAIKEGVKKPINAVIEMVNKMIKALNGLSFDVPSWIPVLGGKSFGFNLKEIPLLAEGGTINQSGKAIVGEAGAELIDLPAGARVTPLTKGQSEIIDYDLLADKVASSMTNALNGILPQLKTVIEVDGSGVFKVVRDEDRKFKRSTGRSAFA